MLQVFPFLSFPLFFLVHEKSVLCPTEERIETVSVNAWKIQICIHMSMYMHMYIFHWYFVRNWKSWCCHFLFPVFLEVLCHPSFLFVSSIFWFFLHLFLHTFHLISLSSSSHHHVILPSPLTSPLLITHLHLPQSQSSSPPTHPSPLTQQGRVCVCVCLCVHLWMCTLVFRTELRERERESCLWSV